VSGRQRVGLELARRRQQVFELDALVAGDTRDRCLAGDVAVRERLHDRRPEALLVVEHIMGNAEPIGDAACVVDVLARAAGPAPDRGSVVIELQRDADDLVTFLEQQGCRHARVDPPGHGDDDALGAHTRSVLARGRLRKRHGRVLE